MAFVKVREGESIDDALRRFKDATMREGTLLKVKQKQYFSKNKKK